MKAPSNRVKYNLASFITLKSANNVRRMHSSTNQDGYEIEKRLTKKGSNIGDIDIELHKKEVERNQPKSIRVMLLGRLENPKIKCGRELYHNETESMIIPLGVKKS